MEAEVGDAIRFFEPEPEIIDWMADQIGNRTFFDVGCGDCWLLQELHRRGRKGLGIDPRYQISRLPIHLMSCVLALDAQECGCLGTIQDAVAIFARPCHNGFVAETIMTIHPSTEIWYISLPYNVEKDIPSWCRAVPFHGPLDQGGETFYRIERN